MRTTIRLDPDVLAAAREISRSEKRTLGEVVSDLARQGLRARPRSGVPVEAGAFYGIEPLPRRGVVVTNHLIDRLRQPR